MNNILQAGFRVFDHPYDLKREQWVKAFDVFTSLPGYASSHFHTELLSYYDGFADEFFWNVEDNLTPPTSVSDAPPSKSHAPPLPHQNSDELLLCSSIENDDYYFPDFPDDSDIYLTEFD